MYKITDYTFEQAQNLDVIVTPSKRKNKKIDIYDNRDRQYITSVGDKRYGDYPTFMETRGKAFAEERRKRFHQRFQNKASVEGSDAYYALKLLW